MTEVIRHFLKVALADSGYKTVQDVLQVLAADLCIGEHP